MDIVLVKWADAHCGPSGWQTLAEYADDGEEIVTTVGFLTPEGTHGFKADHVTIWQTVAGDDAIHPFHIPVGMVRQITILCSLEIGVDS